VISERVATRRGRHVHNVDARCVGRVRLSDFSSSVGVRVYGIVRADDEKFDRGKARGITFSKNFCFARRTRTRVRTGNEYVYTFSQGGRYNICYGPNDDDDDDDKYFGKVISFRRRPDLIIGVPVRFRFHFSPPYGAEPEIPGVFRAPAL